MEAVEAVADERVRSLASEILAREEYGRARPDAEAWRAVLGWLRDLTEWLDQLRIASPVTYTLVMLGLLLVALLLLAHVVWTVSLALRMPAPEAGVEAPGEAAGFLDRAEALAGDGHFVEASRQLQLASLELLLAGQVIELSRFEPNRVLRERLREARLPECERRQLLELVDRLEWRLFRSRSEDRALYDDWRQLHGRLAVLGAPS